MPNIFFGGFPKIFLTPSLEDINCLTVLLNSFGKGGGGGDTLNRDAKEVISCFGYHFEHQIRVSAGPNVGSSACTVRCMQVSKESLRLHLVWSIGLSLRQLGCAIHVSIQVFMEQGVCRFNAVSRTANSRPPRVRLGGLFNPVPVSDFALLT